MLQSTLRVMWRYLELFQNILNKFPLSQLIVDKNPKSLMSEAFRTLRTNLKFLDSTEGSKIISITSTISGEGKTFVAINMAGILAFTDKKVVILDLDLLKTKNS